MTEDDEDEEEDEGSMRVGVGVGVGTDDMQQQQQQHRRRLSLFHLRMMLRGDCVGSDMLMMMITQGNGRRLSAADADAAENRNNNGRPGNGTSSSSVHEAERRRRMMMIGDEEQRTVNERGGGGGGGLVGGAVNRNTSNKKSGSNAVSFRCSWDTVRSEESVRYEARGVGRGGGRGGGGCAIRQRTNIEQQQQHHHQQQQQQQQQSKAGQQQKKMVTAAVSKTAWLSGGTSISHHASSLETSGSGSRSRRGATLQTSGYFSYPEVQELLLSHHVTDNDETVKAIRDNKRGFNGWTPQRGVVLSLARNSIVLNRGDERGGEGVRGGSTSNLSSLSVASSSCLPRGAKTNSYVETLRKRRHCLSQKQLDSSSVDLNTNASTTDTINAATNLLCIHATEVTDGKQFRICLLPQSPYVLSGSASLDCNVDRPTFGHTAAAAAAVQLRSAIIINKTSVNSPSSPAWFRRPPVQRPVTAAPPSSPSPFRRPTHVAEAVGGSTKWRGGQGGNNESQQKGKDADDGRPPPPAHPPRHPLIHATNASQRCEAKRQVTKRPVHDTTAAREQLGSGGSYSGSGSGSGVRVPCNWQRKQ